MFKKISQFENTFHLGKATIIIAVMTLLSRVLGFVRDLLLASQLGLSAESDIYFTAFRIPDMVYNFLILGTLSVSFIPVFSQHYLKDKAKAFLIANTIFNIASGSMVIVCVLIFIFALPLTHLIAPGFSDAQTEATANLTRLMILSPLIFTISNVFSSILISLKRFLIVNTAPLLYNIGIILGIIFLYPHYGIQGLAGGVILGAFLHMGLQAPYVFTYGFRWKPTIDYQDKGVQQVGRLFLPRIFGLDISYINLIIVSIVGSTLLTGSITAFNYANNIQAVALGVFALSTAIALFPVLSELYAKSDISSFISTLQHAIIRILYFIVPISILILLLRAHIVRILLGYGRCDWDCTIITFDTLGVLSLALVGQSLIPLFARAFYARQNTKTPVVVGIVAMAINGVLSYLLSFGLGVTGIALGFAIATTVNCILLFALLHRALHKEIGEESQLMDYFDTTIVKRTTKIIIASMVLGLITYIVLYLIDPLVDTHTVLGLMIQAGTASVLGLIAYIAVTRWMGLYEAEKIMKTFSKALNFINLG